MALVLLLAVTLTRLHAEEVQSATPVLCRIQLAHFCVARGADPFLITLSQKAGDLHGFIFFLEGVGREDKSKRFLVSIRDLQTGRFNLADTPEFCRTFGLSEDICRKGPRFSETLSYEQSFAELPGKGSPEGIRVDVLELHNMDSGALTRIVLPCAASRDGSIQCGAELGMCHRSNAWIGCDFVARPQQGRPRK